VRPKVTGGYMKKITKKDLLILLTMWLSPAAILLLVISIYLVQPKVEAKLVSNVRLVLAEHNIDAEISFSGRDGTLKGEVASQEVVDNAQRLSLAVFGTRIIHNQLIAKDSQYNISEINNELQQPSIKKISYTIEPEQKAYKAINQQPALLIKDEKPQYSSEVEKIMATMQQTVPVIQPNPENATAIIVPLDDDIAETVEIEDAYKDKVIETAPLHIIETKKSPEKQAKSQQISKSTNNLLNIIDDFNLSLGSFIDDSTIDQEEVKPQSVTASFQSIDKIDLSSIQFSSGSITLPTEAHQALDKVAASIKAQSHATIELIAYADDSDIAYARGAAVREYLASKGINKNSIHVSGHTITADEGKGAALKIKTY
jgi:outer membrane protein OmpA-like peptidoglycan-associated protein